MASENHKPDDHFTLETLRIHEVLAKKRLTREKDSNRHQALYLETVMIIANQVELQVAAGKPPVFSDKRETFSDRANHILQESH